jgi:hypothetical protein
MLYFAERYIRDSLALTAPKQAQAVLVEIVPLLDGNTTHLRKVFTTIILPAAI